MKDKNIILDKQVFKEGIGKLAHVYPSWEFDYKNKESMATMYSFFKDLTEEEFNCMVHNHILNEYGAPTVASLNKNKKENIPIDKSKGGGVAGITVDYEKKERIRKLREENQ